MAGMSYNQKLYKNEPKRRFRSWSELDSMQTAAEVGKYEREHRLDPENDTMGFLRKLPNNLSVEKLGWEPGPDGSIPKDAGGNSRMYIISCKDDGTEVLTPYDGKEPPVRSSAFWENVQLGNVFAFPAGDSKPVQLQLSHSDSSRGLSFSRPLEPEEIPGTQPPDPPVRPNVFKRAIHRIFKRAFRQEFEAYRQQKAKTEQWETNLAKCKSELEKIGKNRESLCKAEQAQLAEAKKKKAEAAERQRLQDQVKDARKELELPRRGMERARCAWEPEPKVIETEETKKLFPGRTVKAEPGSLYEKLYTQTLVDEETGKITEVTGFFNKTDFGDVKPIGKDQLDLDTIKKGRSGKSFDTYDFTALTLAATAIPRIGIKGAPHTSAEDPTAVEALANLEVKIIDKENGKEEVIKPFSREEAVMYVSDDPAMHYTTDVMEETPRAGVGRFAKYVNEPARQHVKDALNQYKAGDPSALGEIVAHGIRSVSSCIANKDNIPGDSFKAQVMYSGNLLEMLDADPALKKSAMDAGMKEKDLNTVRGMHKAVQLDRKGAEANLKLAQAAAEGKDLPKDEKMRALRDMIVGKIAIQSIIKENMNTPCPEYDRLSGPVMAQSYGSDPKELAIIEEMRSKGPLPPPPKGRLKEGSSFGKTALKNSESSSTAYSSWR